MSKYIQVEFDAHNKANAIATAAKIGRQWVIAGLVDMWAYCFREQTDIVSGVLIVGFFSEPVGPVLEAFGFLERVTETTWRVKGMGRYTSLSEKRRKAGQKGGQATQAARPEESSKTERSANESNDNAQANQANGGFAQASLKQKGAKDAICQASAQAKGVANAKTGKQNQALDPRSDISLPSGERDIYAREASASAPSEPALGGAGKGAGKAQRARPPTPRYGTPEYAAAEALGHWQLLGWTKYPGESDAEFDARTAENRRLIDAEAEARRGAPA